MSYNVQIWKTSNVEDSNILFPELYSNNNFNIKKPNINGVSIAYPVGGVRASTASTGYTRALIKLGYFNDIQYIGTASGGSWFTGLFLYARSCCDSVCDNITSSGSNYISDEAILGNSCSVNRSGQIDPKNITMNELENKNKDNKKWIGIMSNSGEPTASIIKNIIDKKVPIDRTWSYVIQENMCKFYNLHKNKPITNSYNQAKDIQRNNPSLFPELPYFLRNDSPFWLCSSTMFFDYYNYQYPYIHVTLTPMYSGIPQVININGNKFGGYVMDNFAFGNVSINDIDKNILDNKMINQNSSLIKLNKLQDFKLLSDTLSVSSAVFGSAFLKPEVLGNAIQYFMHPKLKSFLTNYYIWGTLPIIGTNKDSDCKYSLFSQSCETSNGYDSGTCTKYYNSCYSNTAPQCSKKSDCKASIGLTRTCKNINTSQSSLNCRLKPSWNSLCDCDPKGSIKYTPSINNNFNQKAQLSDGSFADPFGLLPLLARQVKKIIIFDNHVISKKIFDPIKSCIEINPYFGKYDKGCDVLYLSRTSQVFSENDYDKLIKELQERTRGTGPIFCRLQLSVLNNKLNGIKPYIVDILFIFVDLCNEFYNSLKDEVKKEITDFSAFDPRAGKLNKFPEYPTFFENSDSVSNYSIAQSNMLSTYTEWIVMHPDIKRHIDDMFRIHSF